MLLDWSGSMDYNLVDAIAQVLTLSQFCRRVNIPYKVVAFSDRSITTDKPFNPNKDDDKIHAYIMNHRVRMMTLLDSKMSASEYELMSRMMYTRELTRVKDENRETIYELCGTPLTEALIGFYNNIEQYQKELGVQKLSLITVTDGEGNSNYLQRNGDGKMYRWYDGRQFLRDPKTNRVVDVDHSSTGVQNSMIELISMKGVKTVGFFIASGRSRSFSDISRSYNINFDWKQAGLTLSRNGYVELNVGCYDKFFVIPRNIEAVETELNVNSDMSAAKIAKAIGSTFKSFNKSRVVLTKFIETIA
jgi:hypothetical protein